MPDLTSEAIASNYNKHAISQSGVGREFIVSITADADTLTDAKLKEALDYMTLNHGSGGTGDSEIGRASCRERV